MPAIVTAIVIRWEVEEGQEPTFYDEKSVSMYVGDAEEGSLEVRLIGQYILEEAEEDEDEIGELLEAARDGLLQVTNIEKREVKPPSAPPRHRRAQTQTSGEKTEDERRVREPEIIVVFERQTKVATVIFQSVGLLPFVAPLPCASEATKIYLHSAHARLT